MSLRPTMNSIDTFSYECARYLATVLSPMVGKTQHHVKNSKDFAEEATKIKVEPAQRDEIICCLSRMDDTKLAMGTSQPQKMSSDCWSCAWNALFSLMVNDTFRFMVLLCPPLRPPSDACDCEKGVAAVWKILMSKGLRDVKGGGIRARKADL